MTTITRPGTVPDTVLAAQLAAVEGELLTVEDRLVEAMERYVELSADRAQLRHRRHMSVRNLPAENALAVLLAGRFGANGPHLALVLLRLAHDAEPPTVVYDAPTEPPSSLE